MTQPQPILHAISLGAGVQSTTMAPRLAEMCIAAGCPEGGTVLDPFAGAGTTGLAARGLSRNAVLVELNPDFAEIARKRLEREGEIIAEAA